MTKTRTNKEKLCNYIALDITRQSRLLYNLSRELERTLWDAESFGKIPYSTIKEYAGEVISLAKEVLEHLEESINKAGESADSKKEAHEN